ncbi:hypothetical protein YC2023_114651 [Brassica napus]
MMRKLQQQQVNKNKKNLQSKEEEKEESVTRERCVGDTREASFLSDTLFEDDSTVLRFVRLHRFFKSLHRLNLLSAASTFPTTKISSWIEK